MLSDPGLNLIRRELRRLTPGIRVELSEIEVLLRNEVLKRNILEAESFAAAQKRIKKIQAKPSKSK